MLLNNEGVANDRVGVGAKSVVMAMKVLIEVTRAFVDGTGAIRTDMNVGRTTDGVISQV